MFIVVRQYTKANSSYVNSYLAINLILCFLLLRPGVCTLIRVSVCVEHEPEEEVGLLSETKQQSKAFPVWPSMKHSANLATVNKAID